MSSRPESRRRGRGKSARTQAEAGARNVLRRAIRRRGGRVKATPNQSARGSLPRSGIPAMYISPPRSKKFPSISARGPQMRVVHTEPLGPVTSTSAAFTTFTWPVQPGMSESFPWLSTMASLYETYTINRLVYRFENAVGTTTAGFMTMAVDLDPLDPAPTSMQEVGQYRESVGGPVFIPHAMPVNASLMNQTPGLHTRQGNVSSSDLKTYDAGNFYICLEGVNAALIGYLYIDYDVTLHTPQPAVPMAGKLYNTTGLNADALFGTAAAATITGIMPFIITAVDTITFNQEWQGLMSLKITGAGIIAAVTDTGSAAVTVLAEDHLAAGTSSTSILHVRATRGQTVILHEVGGGAVSSVTYYVALARYASI